MESIECLNYSPSTCWFQPLKCEDLLLYNPSSLLRTAPVHSHGLSNATYWKRTQNTPCSFQVTTNPALPSPSCLLSQHWHCVPPGSTLCGNRAETRGRSWLNPRLLMQPAGRADQPGTFSEPRRWSPHVHPRRCSHTALEQLEQRHLHPFFSSIFNDLSIFLIHGHTHPCFPREEHQQHKH